MAPFPTLQVANSGYSTVEMEKQGRLEKLNNSEERI